MSTLIIYYEAKCKHCRHCGTKKNTRGRKQAYCELKQEFIRLKDKACEKLEL